MDYDHDELMQGIPIITVILGARSSHQSYIKKKATSSDCSPCLINLLFLRHFRLVEFLLSHPVRIGLGRHTVIAHHSHLFIPEAPHQYPKRL